jgi:glycine/D-amino acid oxidase-like deaminating enzyme
MVTFWEQRSFLQYDVIVIGAGITGLSTALSLRELAPGYKIAVLERGVLPYGASLRNAGFACIGSLTEMLDDLGTMGESRLVELVRMRMNGLSQLRARLGDRRIGYRDSGSFELLTGTESLMEEMESVNRLLLRELGKTAFSVADDRVKAFGFDPAFVSGMIRNHLEGELDTGRMMRSLWDALRAQGVDIFTGCKVTGLEENARWVNLEVSAPETGGNLRFRGTRVAVCTNAFIPELLTNVPVRPARGQVLLTAPVASLPFRGIFHFDKGYYYFRELAGRVLLGGGRNLDFSGEATTAMEVTGRIQHDLEEKLRQVILPGTEVKIERRWAGIMGFGPDRFPLVKAYSSRIFLAAGMGGMGIAVGSEVGRRLAGLIIG